LRNAPLHALCNAPVTALNLMDPIKKKKTNIEFGARGGRHSVLAPIRFGFPTVARSRTTRWLRYRKTTRTTNQANFITESIRLYP